jgi:Phage tail assembly chaperone protein
MQALIDKRNNRICQIEPDNSTFPVAADLEWLSCPDTCNTTWNYNGTTFIAPAPPVGSVPLTNAQKLANIRADRDNRLTATDYTQLADTPSTINKAAWATYRQALRDLPDSPNLNLDAPAWPTPPSNTPSATVASNA